tara:strand:+ start:9185 stop:10876 length:1692 start_codon:yes stop_codon:yes gene_type:complete
MSKLNVNQISSLSGGNISLDGQVTGTSASFSGNVSIGGSLTFDKVTNVDSVGLITAKNGIQVLANGINAVGVISATSFSGDGSQLSNISGGGEFDFVASGTIPNGAAVVVNTDGTVGVITQTTSTVPTLGSETVFNSAESNFVASAYDSTNGKVVIAYQDYPSATKGFAIVGTVSGTSITFGSAVEFNAGPTTYLSCTYDSSNSKVVISYTDNGVSGTSIVGTVSGTSISFGSPVVFNVGNTSDISSTYDTTNSKVVIAYSDNANSDKGTAVVGTVSGTSISFGSEVFIDGGAASSKTSCTYDSANGKILVSFRDDGFSSVGRTVVGTVSGTSITFGSDISFTANAATSISSTYDSTNDKLIVAYEDEGNSDYGTVNVGTVSGTSITWGPNVVFNAGDTSDISCTYDSTNDKVVIAYRNIANSSYGTLRVGTVSGTSIGFGSTTVFNTGNTIYTAAIYDSTNDKVVIPYRDASNSNYGTSIVLSTQSQTTNLTTGNYIGIAKNSIADGATGKINIPTGINTSQSGLTTGRTYYVQPNGTLSTSADTPLVVAGTSISDTDLLIK